MTREGTKEQNLVQGIEAFCYLHILESKTEKDCEICYFGLSDEID